MSVNAASKSISVTGADELMLVAHDYGGCGEPLVFLHGFGHDHHVWDEIAPAFVDAFRVLAFDLRGHGASARDPGFRYHHVSIGKDLARIVEALGAARVSLVAHSTAGHACIGYAARFPDRVAKLVLVDAGAELRPSGGRSGSGERGERSERAEPAGDGSFASIAEYVAVLTRLHPGASRELLERLASHWLRERADGRYELTVDERFWRPRPPKPKAGAHAEDTASADRPAFDRKSWAEQGEEALWRDLGATRCPTLVVRGARSPMLRAATVERMVREVLVHGRAAEIPNSGHVPMIDNPQALRATLERFLAGE